MRLSIGVIACNEEKNIGNMLRSTFAQSIFFDSCSIYIDAISLIVVSNGCTDNTSTAASQIFAEYSAERRDVALAVHQLERGDKANAWNVFVHELSPIDADVLVFLDADIEFASDTVLESLLRCIEEDMLAQVVTDVPVARMDKSIGMLAALALKIGSRVGDSVNRHAICGQCYAGRASTLRGILIPPGLPVEDGFVRACVITGGFKHPDRPNMVRVEPLAQHFFKPATTFSDVIHHQVRLTVGTIVNGVLFDILWREAPMADSVAAVVRQRLEGDANWISAALDDYIQPRGRWVIPMRMLFRRIDRMRGLPFLSSILKWPLAIATTAFDLVVCWRANSVLRQGKAAGFW